MEVISASNTVQEMIEKNLYFEAGASECWICSEAGVVSFYYHRSGQQVKSVLVSDFPSRIEW